MKIRFIHSVPLRYTVAYRLDPTGVYYEVGIAKCGRKDNFSRRIGRLVASGRLEKYPIFVANSLDRSDPKWIRKEVSFILNSVNSWLESSSVPLRPSESSPSLPFLVCSSGLLRNQSPTQLPDGGLLTVRE